MTEPNFHRSNTYVCYNKALFSTASRSSSVNVVKDLTRLQQRQFNSKQHATYSLTRCLSVSSSEMHARGSVL